MGTRLYTGTIIEESLADLSVLDGVHIVATTVEPVTENHETPWISQWTMYTVEIPEDAADIFAQKLSGTLDRDHSWYADFKRDSDHYIIFTGKIFHITDRADKKQYDAATEYGRSLNIPEHQLDFSPHIKTWGR